LLVLSGTRKCFLKNNIYKIVKRKVDEELGNLKKEVGFLNQLKSDSTLEGAIFYYEIYLSHSHVPEAVTVNTDYQTAIKEGEKMVKDKPTHWAKRKLYILVPVTQEIIAHIGRVGISGKSLMSGSGLTTRMLMEYHSFSLKEVETLESSIAFFIPERAWKTE